MITSRYKEMLHEFYHFVSYGWYLAWYTISECELYAKVYQVERYSSIAIEAVFVQVLKDIN